MGKFLIIIRGPIFLISATILGIIILPIGLLYSIGKMIYEAKFIKFFKRMWEFFLEILFVLSWICERLAVGIDILGNVVAGELFEDCVTTVEDTLYGKHGITLSASTGDLEIKEKLTNKNIYLNKTGLFFTKLLSKVFENNHSILAYKYYKLNKKLLEETKKLNPDEDYSWV